MKLLITKKKIKKKEILYLIEINKKKLKIDNKNNKIEFSKIYNRVKINFKTKKSSIKRYHLENLLK